VYIFWGGEEREPRITYAQLYADACIYAQLLRSLGIQQGGLVLLVFDYGYEVLAAFFVAACVTASQL
jgi:acyl-coenzyme A synthetase/AMP-(fatty) acid ligase